MYFERVVLKKYPYLSEKLIGKGEMAAGNPAMTQ